MDLPDAEDKLAELKEQLQNPHGKVFFVFFLFSFQLYQLFQFSRNSDINWIIHWNIISILKQKSVFKQKFTQFNCTICSTIKATELGGIC